MISCVGPTPLHLLISENVAKWNYASLNGIKSRKSEHLPEEIRFFRIRNQKSDTVEALLWWIKHVIPVYWCYPAMTTNQLTFLPLEDTWHTKWHGRQKQTIGGNLPEVFPIRISLGNFFWKWDRSFISFISDKIFRVSKFMSIYTSQK